MTVVEPVRYTDLQDKVVWITGAAQGMGFSMAQAFTAQGARLALLDIDRTGLEQARAILGLDQSRCQTWVASVTEADAVNQVADEIEQTFGAIDVLIANAGVSMNKPSLEVTADEWLRAVNINLNGVFFCVQAAGRHMVAKQSGAIVCMGSVYGVSTAPNRAAYCASKSAVVALSQSLAAEWARLGVRVNALCPGYVQTPFLADLMQRGVLDVQELESRIPLGELASPEQIAQVSLYMASDASRYMTGHAMVVDGGWTADSFKALK
jgi:NAD(P)-dependent dehydrogenase (short-subunit alcohol dehydrogenase family)